MTDENTPLREQVDRQGYAFNMGVAEIIRRTRNTHRWHVEAEEVQWSLDKERGFIDVAIERDRAIGIIECKKVTTPERLVFLTRTGAPGHEDWRYNRSRLEVYFQKFPEKEGELPGLRELRRQTEPRFVVGDCVLAMAPPQSSYCVAEKNTQVDKRTLDAIARHLLDSCEGLLGNWDFKLPGNPTACIPIIVTNATLWTCAFDPAQMDLGSGDLPPAATFQPQPFVRFRKAFRHSPGLMAPTEMHHLVQVVEQGERTVFVVDARHLVPFLTGLRDLRFPNPDGTHCAHQLVDD